MQSASRQGAKKDRFPILCSGCICRTTKDLLPLLQAAVEVVEANAAEAVRTSSSTERPPPPCSTRKVQHFVETALFHSQGSALRRKAATPGHRRPQMHSRIASVPGGVVFAAAPRAATPFSPASWRAMSTHGFSRSRADPRRCQRTRRRARSVSTISHARVISDFDSWLRGAYRTLTEAKFVSILTCH
jgi:hypothetical protein